MGKPVVHFEIGLPRPGKDGEYFSELYGWSIAEYGPASMIDTSSGRRIQGHLSLLGHEKLQYTTFYVAVDGIQTSLDKPPVNTMWPFTPQQ